MNRFALFYQLPCILRRVVGMLLGAVLLVTLANTLAVAQFSTPTQLVLQNGWVDAGFTTSHAMVQESNGIVQFRGSIEGGTSSVAFTLPPALSPATTVYIPVDMCNATNGRLIIQPSGVVSVQAETSFSNAQCFTSLDGAQFTPNATGYTNLTLVNGWTGAPFATSVPAVRVIAGGVHLKGAMATTGTNPVAFTLPASARPKTDVYVPVDLCNATNGRLHITPAGVVDVEAEGGNFNNAQCFTSLDGVWFGPTPTGYSAITLQNGWTNAPFSTSNAAAANAWGGVYLKGAIGSGTSAQAFTLGPRFRPITNVYVNVDMCNATKGRLLIQTNGVVTVQAESSFTNAQCFTSLDGVSFVQ